MKGVAGIQPACCIQRFIVFFQPLLHSLGSLRYTCGQTGDWSVEGAGPTLTNVNLEKFPDLPQGTSKKDIFKTHLRRGDESGWQSPHRKFGEMHGSGWDSAGQLVNKTIL